MYSLITDELEAQFADQEVRKRWLVLDTHPDFPGHWAVEGFTNDYLYDLGEIIGFYRALAPAGLQRFLEAAESFGYQVAFFEDPTAILDQFRYLDAEPDVSINSTFENTVNGMLPYQVQGYNYLKDQEYGVARWDTGTGKTVLAAALIKAHWDEIDMCFVVVKKNNKINTKRKLWTLGDVMVDQIRGTKEQRLARWEMHAKVRGGIVVINYEQFKDFVVTEDSLKLTDLGERLFTDRNLMFIWDEMPVKLKTRTTDLYRAVCKCLYKTAPPQVSPDRLRPKTMRSYMLSATPIENSPEDWFNCLRLMDGGRTYGTVSDFNNTYVSHWNYYDSTKPYAFHNLERMRLKTAHCVHQVSKADPDVAAVFPKAIEEPVYIDWDGHNGRLYTEIQELARGVIEQEDFAKVPIFSLIGTLQMLCDAPEMINDSAARREVYEDALESWELSHEGREPRTDGSEFALQIPEHLKAKLTNKNHPKLEKLREMLLERHPGDQVVIYTRFNQTIMPYLESHLQQWGVSYGTYRGTERQQQAVQDAFQAGDVRVFLSSDSGSDSIDLDAGSVVIDYNLPWKWTTVTQRHNRIHRPTSQYQTVYYYSLLMENSVEERAVYIISKKKGYHNELFNPAGGDLSASAKMTRAELTYILTGRP